MTLKISMLSQEAKSEIRCSFQKHREIFHGMQARDMSHN